MVKYSFECNWKHNHVNETLDSQTVFDVNVGKHQLELLIRWSSIGCSNIYYYYEDKPNLILRLTVSL